jgi:hypothetical protein
VGLSWPVVCGAQVGVLLEAGHDPPDPECWSLGAQLGIGGLAVFGAAGHGSGSAAAAAAG